MGSGRPLDREQKSIRRIPIDAKLMAPPQAGPFFSPSFSAVRFFCLEPLVQGEQQHGSRHRVTCSLSASAASPRRFLPSDVGALHSERCSQTLFFSSSSSTQKLKPTTDTSSLRARGGTGKAGGGRKASAPRASRVDEDDVATIEEEGGNESASRPASASASRGGSGRRSASRGQTPGEGDEEDQIYDLEYVSDDDGGGGEEDGDPACAVAGPLTLAARQQQQQHRAASAAASAEPFSTSLAGEPADFTSLKLKPDHAARPLWVCPDGRIFLETFSPVYRQATDFLVAVAEPLSRPATLHEYALTPHSLYAAVSVGLSAGSIVAVLQRLSKVELPPEVADFVAGATGNFGKVKLVLRRSRFHVEASDPAILRQLLKDKTITKARVLRDAEGEEIGPGSGSDEDDEEEEENTADDDGDDLHDLRVGDAPEELAGVQIAAEVVAGIEEAEAEAAEQQAAAAAAGGETGTTTGTAAAAPAAAAPRPLLPSDELQRFLTPATGSAPASQVHSFEIRPSRVEHVKARCLPGALIYFFFREESEGDSQRERTKGSPKKSTRNSLFFLLPPSLLPSFPLSLSLSLSPLSLSLSLPPSPSLVFCLQKQTGSTIRCSRSTTSATTQPTRTSPSPSSPESPTAPTRIRP